MQSYNFYSKKPLFFSNFYYFCKNFIDNIQMKKIFSICLIICTLILCGCKEAQVTTYYTIGCLEFSTSTIGSDWAGFERYMKSVAAYNTNVSFTNKTAEENDDAATKYFTEQVAKINPDSARAYIGNSDYLIYGIAKNLNEESQYYILKAVKFTSGGMTDYTVNNTK